jgi:hypothetical protein
MVNGYGLGITIYSKNKKTRITSQSSSPAKDAGLDSAKNAPPLISDVEAVEKP